MDGPQEWHDEAGESDAAEELFGQMLRLDAAHADTVGQSDTLDNHHANLAAGIEMLQQAAARHPRAAEIHSRLGLAYRAQGALGQAAQSFERALQIDPNYAQAWCHLAEMARGLGRTENAVEFLTRAISLNPRDAKSLCRLGEILFEHENWAAAEQCFLHALSLDEAPNDDSMLTVWNKLGIAFVRQEKLDLAAGAFRRILQFAPDMAEMHANLAYVFERQGRLEQALAEGCRAVELKPDYAEGNNNLGVVYRSLHRLPEARKSFKRAIELSPEFALARFNLGTIDFFEGDYRNGWGGYEWRHATPGYAPRQIAAMRWDGRPLPGRTLLVHAEQGYGDTLLFARFVRLAKQRSQANVVFEVPAPLAPLMTSLAGVDELVIAVDAPPECDAEIPLPSLPAALEIDLNSIGAAVPYLSAPVDRASTWRDRIAQLARATRRQASGEPGASAPGLLPMLKVGIAWQGNSKQSQDLVRSCRLADFARLLDVPGIAWFSLQKDASEQSLKCEWPPTLPLIPLGPMLVDFADTAAAVAALDLIIAVDTSVAHLAGAMGRPCWTLLCHTPDWRWQLERTDSAWYPTMKLFRQPRWGDWPPVFRQVREALASERRASAP